MFVALIMAGGSGVRFWPLSTSKKPKQLLTFFSDKTLLRETYERVRPLCDFSSIFISTNPTLASSIRKELPELPFDRLIIEPEKRDTSAAIGYAATIISKYFDNPTIAVLPSDHWIANNEEFRKTLMMAAGDSAGNKIVTIGIAPTKPETGYGYIETPSAQISGPQGILSFHEKPDYKTAVNYLSEKRFLWNSGIFVFSSSTLFSAFEKYAPSTYNILMQIKNELRQDKRAISQRKIKRLFAMIEKKSIDYAIMEKAENIDVVPGFFGWNDVGSFLAFDELLSKDLSKNVVKNTNYISFDSANNVIVSDKMHQRVSLLGIHDSVIIITSKEILVAKKNSLADLKKINHQ